MLLVRIRTVRGKQLAVGCAFNRLVKIAFDEHKISSRDPTPMLIVPASAAPNDGDGSRDVTLQRRRA